jgi:hypothetical protein
VSGAILGDVVERDYRLIIGRQLNPELGLAWQGIRLSAGAHNNVLNGLKRDHPQLQGLLQRGSDAGLSLLEARAINSLSERGPAAASQGTKSNSRRAQLGAGGLAPWSR